MHDLNSLHIDADIRRASTLPGWVYTDPAVLEACREQVFAPSWQFVTDADRKREPGHVLPFALLEGLLDEPLLLTRDRDDRLHCVSNVCTHRANLVCEHEGVETGLRCRYHGRRFGLDGAFTSMPAFEHAENFPTPADSLPRVPFGAWEQFLFASIAGVLDYGEYTTELFDRSNLQLGIAQGAEDAIDLPASSPDRGRRIAAYYWWLWPNTMFNVYPWGVSINVVRPLGTALTKVSFLTYVWDASRIDQGAGAGLDRVEREDEVIVEAVQRGLRSRLYDRGRYSPAREGGVHHFHRILVGALAGI